MLAATEVISYLQEKTPLYYADPWDPVGVSLGDPARPTHKALTCVTLCSRVVAECTAHDIDLAITHHPFPFSHQLTELEQTSLQQLQHAEVVVYSSHTAYDNVPGGINDQLLSMALEDATCNKDRNTVKTEFLRHNKVVYYPNSEHRLVGAGKVVEAPEDLDLTTTASRVMAGIASQKAHQKAGQLVSQSSTRVVRSRDNKVIRRLCAACGVASSFVDDCLKRQVDLLICGELRYHECLKLAESGCHVILLGHHLSERFAMERLATELSNRFHQLDVRPSIEDTCPVAPFNHPTQRTL